MPLTFFRQKALGAALLFLAVFGLYTHTLSPAFHPDDSPETITAAFTLSHQHPPGYPLHSLLGRVAVLGSPGGPAFSVNLVAAFFGALAVALALACLVEILTELAPWESQRQELLLGALAMALALGCTQTFWFQATIAKGGIYTLNLALTFATLLCVLKVRSAGLACLIEQLRGQGSFAGGGLSCGCPAPQALQLAGLFFGLGFANHWTSQIVLLPGYAVLLAESRVRRDGWPRAADLLRMALWPAAFAALGLSLYVYLPLRARLGAPLVWGAADTWKGFLWIFDRSQYAGIEQSKSLAVFMALLLRIGQNVAADFTGLGAAALLLGWALLFRRRAFLAAGLLLLPLTLALAVAWKANPPSDSYFIIDPYLLPVHLGLGLGLAGFGGVAQVRRWLGPGFLAGALALASVQFSVCDHADDFLGYDYIRNLLLSAPKDALLYCEGDSNTAGPFYERFVRGHRKDLTLVPVVLSDYPWMRQALQRQDPSLRQPPAPLGPGGNMAWMAVNNHGRPVVWTNSYTKAWATEALLLHRGLVLVQQSKPQAAWTPAQLSANDIFKAYALRGVFKPYQRVQDPITVRLVQDNYVEAEARLAQALYASGAMKASAEKFRLLGRLKPGWAPPWVQAGNSEYQAHDLAAAGRDWSRAVDEDPRSAEAQADLGLFYFDSRDYDRALSQANKALRLAPEMPNAKQLRELAMQRIGGVSPAPAPAAAPGAQAGMADALQGDQYAQSGHPAEALAAYTAAIKHGFANAGVYRNRGVMLMQLSRSAEAITELKQSVAMDPKNAEVRRYLGVLLYNTGDRAQGTKYIRESAKLDPKNAETQALLKQLGPL